MIRKLLLAAGAALALCAPAHAQFVYYPGWFKTLPNGSTLTDTAAGTFQFGGGVPVTLSTASGNFLLTPAGGSTLVGATATLGFNARAVITSPADGVLLRTKNAGGQLTVSALPSCTSGLDGARASVTDATATTFASTVAGSGANHVPVYCDGAATAWKIG